MRSTEKLGTIRGVSRRHAGVACCVVLAAAASGLPAMADQVVYFVNGKAMTVKSVEKGPKVTVLEVEGGGRIGVPTLQIERIEDLTVSPPPATMPATAIIQPPPAPQAPGAQPPAAQPTGPSQAAVGTTAPQAAPPQQPPAVGPSSGGKVQGNGNLPGPSALSVGPDEPEDARPGGLKTPGQAGVYAPGGQDRSEGAASRYNGGLGNPAGLQRRLRPNLGHGRPGTQPNSGVYYRPGQGNQAPGNNGQPAAGQQPGQTPNGQGNGQGSAAPSSGSAAGSGQQSAPPAQAPAPPPQAQPQPPPQDPDPGQNDPGADDAGSDDSQQQGSSDGGSNQN